MLLGKYDKLNKVSLCYTRVHYDKIDTQFLHIKQLQTFSREGGGGVKFRPFFCS